MLKKSSHELVLNISMQYTDLETWICEWHLSVSVDQFQVNDRNKLRTWEAIDSTGFRKY